MCTVVVVIRSIHCMEIVSIKEVCKHRSNPLRISCDLKDAACGSRVEVKHVTNIKTTSGYNMFTNFA